VGDTPAVTVSAPAGCGGRYRSARSPHREARAHHDEVNVIELRTAHTADLDASTRSAIRRLLDAAFDGIGDGTFENVLGGVHVLVVEEGELVGHGSVVQRRLLHAGRALRAGYVEGVAVRADRRRGHGAAVMSVLERVVRAAYQLGGLGASIEGGRLYAARGGSCGGGHPRL
jgi:aminoglycoside 2'-N-acetyltransferase I